MNSCEELINTLTTKLKVFAEIRPEVDNIKNSKSDIVKSINLL